jgi:ABC-2 type transport system ATP-binding protein
MIEVANLTKRYGRVTAVSDLSFTVGRGEIMGFLGPNGAGKTTTMQILAGYRAPTGGRVTIAGLDALNDSVEVRERIGYMPESVPLYPDMRVNEYLKFRGRLKGLYGGRLRTRVQEVMALCGLDEVRRAIIGNLSKGYRQRVGVADSLVHEPEVLILDEPTIGLDPNQIRQIRSLIRGLAGRHTVLLSSHILSEVEMICQRVLILHRGRMVAADTPANLGRLLRGHGRVVAEIRGPPDEVARKAAELPGAARVACETEGAWTRLTLEPETGEDLREGVCRMAAEAGWPLRELRAEKPNLEDVFVEITRDEAPEKPAA